jgi:UDPglucose 6-dehydrogenase
MSFINAEITKLSVNTYITAKISFANMLARICERLPGADVDVVTGGLGLDSRIGAKYLKGAISYGGPCFPRDNVALAALAQQVGAPAELAQVTDRFNRWQVKWLADMVQQYSSPGGAVGILGLAYKPNTDVIEEAFGLLLAQELAQRGLAVIAYDPATNGNAAQLLGSQVRLASTAQECIDASQVVTVATPWQEFVQLPVSHWTHRSEPRIVIDCWRVLKHLAGIDGVRYLSLGTGAVIEPSPSRGRAAAPAKWFPLDPGASNKKSSRAGRTPSPERLS